MSMENVISFEELERRRKKSLASRKQSVALPTHTEHESEAMAAINEIFNPSLKIPQTVGPYRIPDEVRADDLEALKDLDVRKLAELKEVFLLFDTDCDGLLSKDDMRMTYNALGGEASEEMLDQMLKEAKEPLDYDAFVELMSHRTIELDPEDVLLEAWSKWDDYGTGKIDEKRCSDYIEIFPYLREPVIENTTQPEYVLCNPSPVANNSSSSSSNLLSIADLQPTATTFIYSAAKIFGIRVRFRKPRETHEANALIFNLIADYRFLKKDNFRNDGRLIAGSYCDYYFFASADAADTQLLDFWQYFHSPRFPAKYPAHIKCAYKFIGRPESRVELIFEELHLPRQLHGCNLDKLTIFDAESANMNAVIDVICDVLPVRRIISSGPDMLIEFNASSNVTAKGFRGKFRFPQRTRTAAAADGNATTTNVAASVAMQAGPTIGTFNSMTKGESLEKYEKLEKSVTMKRQQQQLLLSQATSKKLFKEALSGENCKQTFHSSNNKSGIFDSASVIAASSYLPNLVNNIIPMASTLPGRVQCRYEFYGAITERVQIKFLDFNMPTETKNSSDCKQLESLQLLEQVRGKYEATELYCGAFLPKPLMSNGAQLMLQFMGKCPSSGTKSNYYGFRAEYKFVTNFGITTGDQQSNNCTFMYNSTVRKSGWFGSPNFPGLYPQNLICNYYFYGQMEEKVIIRFTYFDVEGIGVCEYLTASDYVEFSNFLSTDRKYPRYCGKRDKFEIHSDGRFFRVTFYSNDRFDKTGFRAMYDFESTHMSEENTSVQSFISGGAETLLCNQLHFVVYVFSVIYFCYCSQFGVILFDILNKL